MLKKVKYKRVKMTNDVAMWHHQNTIDPLYQSQISKIFYSLYLGILHGGQCFVLEVCLGRK